MTQQPRVEAFEAQTPCATRQTRNKEANSTFPPTRPLHHCWFGHQPLKFSSTTAFNLEAPLGNYVNAKYALVIHALVIELT